MTIESLFLQIWFILQHFYSDYIYQFKNSINLTYNIFRADSRYNNLVNLQNPLDYLSFCHFNFLSVL